MDGNASIPTGARIGQLDGVRALAFLMVFAVHVEFFEIGWAGVNLFFVLSGLLITGILRRSRTDNSYWAPFYIKRATRILPALLIAFVAAAILGSVAWKQVGLYEVFFLANIGETLHRGSTGTLGVLWSLAVEEQFYFLWPFAVRFLTRSQLLVLLAVILIGEPILRGAATPIVSSFWPIFFLTPFQLDGLAAGAMIALLLEDDRETKVLGAWSGKMLIASTAVFAVLSLLPSFHRWANSILFNSIGYSLINLIGGSLIAYLLLCEDTWLKKIFGSPIPVYLGAISYGLYLFHPIALELGNRIGLAIHFHHNRTLAPATFLAVVIFSGLSFRFYEGPITAWGRRRSRSLQLAKGNTQADLARPVDSHVDLAN